jgi:hypothetical protein
MSQDQSEALVLGVKPERGLGASPARRFAREDHQVIVTARGARIELLAQARCTSATLPRMRGIRPISSSSMPAANSRMIFTHFPPKASRTRGAWDAAPSCSGARRLSSSFHLGVAL